MPVLLIVIGPGDLEIPCKIFEDSRKGLHWCLENFPTGSRCYGLDTFKVKDLWLRDHWVELFKAHFEARGLVYYFHLREVEYGGSLLPRKAG